MTVPSERTSREILSARASRRPPSFAVTLVALAIIFAIAWMFFLRSGPAVPAPAIGGAQGTFTWQPASRHSSGAGAFSAVASGNAGGWAGEGATPSGGRSPDSVYDAGSRTETTLGGVEPWASYQRLSGAWPPVWRVATHSPLDYQGLAAVVRTAVEDGDDAVGTKPLKDGDRTVWRAAMTLAGRQLVLVVDQESGLVTWYTDGESTFTAEVDWSSPPPAGETYAVDAPAGTKVDTKTVEAYTYAASPADAGGVAGYDPLVSDLAPDGYRLKAVATVESGDRPHAWLHDGRAAGPAEAPPAPAPAEPAVAQLYTRGLTWFSVEQIGPQATEALAASLPNALDAAADEKLSYELWTLQYGAFKGATAATWYQASGPSLLVVGDGRAAFVTGALTRQELIAFAEGLKPVPANAGR